MLMILTRILYIFSIQKISKNAMKIYGAFPRDQPGFGLCPGFHARVKKYVDCLLTEIRLGGAGAFEGTYDFQRSLDS